MIGRLIALVICLVAVAGLYFLVQEGSGDRGGRVMFYEPGAYQGTPDKPLDAAQQEALRSRARNQNAL